VNKQEQSMRSLCTTYLCSFVHLFFCPFSTVIFWLFTAVVSFVLFIQLQMKGKGMRELNKGTKTTTAFRV